MPRRGQVVMQLRVRDGRLQKRCSRCKQWKDAKKEFYVRTYGRDVRPMPRSWCKLCENGIGAPAVPQHGLVWYSDIARYVSEAVRRIGAAEFARRAKMTHPHLWAVMKGHRRSVRRTTAARMLAAARGVLRSGELRSREEIHHGNRRGVHEPSDGGAEGIPR